MKALLIGPFKQLLTMRDLPLKGTLRDDQLEIIEHGAIYVVDGNIAKVGAYDSLLQEFADAELIVRNGQEVCLPSYIDCHTHIAFAGNRANDFGLRNAGSSYLEIAQAGGGIWSTVQHTRACSEEELKNLTVERAEKLLAQGITTVEVKSGYGLNLEQELKTLRAIQKANSETSVDLISTCLAAHMKPRDFEGSNKNYLNHMQSKLLPVLQAEKLTHRIDAFIEQSAFSADEVTEYLLHAKEFGFDITLHADQFTTSGSKLAVEMEAVSVDHLEVSTEEEIKSIANSDVVAVALPAASIGLGCSFTPARALLDAGASLAIATDWNPGSAPMGQLITSASILATMQKLSNAELLAAVTFRAAYALRLWDRGRLNEGYIADFNIYNTNNYQNITYFQGSLQPFEVWKNGAKVFSNS